MTDEKLNQVLKDALSPKINEEDIKVKNHFALNKKKKHKGLKIGAAAAAAMALTIGGIGVFNPALAAQMPIIGYTFQNMQKSVSYSGDYTDKAVVLEKNENNSKSYTAEDNGVTITASEVYCDGYSIFLAMDIEMKDKDLTKVTQHYINEDEFAYGFYLDGTYTLDGEEEKFFPFNNEGDIIGNDTFAALVKINLYDKLTGTHNMKINLTAVGYDDETKLDGTRDEMDPTDWTTGKWSFDIPITVDTSDVKVIKVNQKSQGVEPEFTLNEVAVSPYQVVVNMDVPTLKNENFTKEIEDDIKNDKDLTDEEKEKVLEEIRSYPMFTNTLIYTQDGKELLGDWEYAEYAYFPVHNNDITKLKIFIFGDPENEDQSADSYISMHKEGLGSSCADNAQITAEIDVK